MPVGPENLSERSSNLGEDKRYMFHNLCLMLSNQAKRVDWASFSPAMWNLFSCIARAEGVAPLAYSSIRNLSLDIPAGTLEALSSAYYISAARNAFLYKNLVEILEVLTDTKVPVIILKGAAMANVLYPEIALRPMNDIDLLVPKENLQVSCDALKLIGYKEDIPELVPGFNLKFGYHIQLSGKDKPLTPLELHWTLIAGQGARFKVPIDWFWANIEDSSFTNHDQMILKGAFPAVLSPTANLLYLCAHQMLQHGGKQALLLWLYDIDLLIRRRQKDICWQELIALSQTSGLAPALFHGLRSTKYLFGTPITEDFLQALLEESNQTVIQMVNLKSRYSKSRLYKDWQTLATFDWPTRFKYVLALIFPSRRYMAWRYKFRHNWPWPLYYLYRWVDVISSSLVGLPEYFENRKKHDRKN